MDPLQLTENWQIPAADLAVKFVRSSGPGGQNVNKVSTKVELRFALSDTEVLTSGQKVRFAALFPGAVTLSGECVLVCDEHRSQQMNLEAVRERLRHMILKAERPQKARRPTAPSRGAKKRRVADKRHRAEVKRTRGSSYD